MAERIIMAQVSKQLEIDFLRIELDQTYRLLLEADTVARKRGDKYGLCDEIDNDGKPYPSAWGERIRERALNYVIEQDKIPVVNLR